MTHVSGNPSYYEVLGIAPTATAHEVKSAYRRLSRQIHPDAGGNGTLFHLVATAYETLSDPIRRTAYDLSLREVAEVPPSAEPTIRHRRNRAQRPAPSSYSVLRRRRLVAGAAIGALWYVLRATGLLSEAIGSRVAEWWPGSAIETWAQPFTVGKLLLCSVLGGLAGSSRQLSRVGNWVRSITWEPLRSAVLALLFVSVLLLEYLVSVQGRQALLGFTVIVALARRFVVSWRHGTSRR